MNLRLFVCVDRNMNQLAENLYVSLHRAVTFLDNQALDPSSEINSIRLKYGKSK